MLTIRTPVFTAALALATATPVFAQEADSWQRFVDAIASDAISQRVYERDMQAGFMAGLSIDTEMVENEAECPGLFTGIRDAVGPVMRASHDLDYGWYRQELEALFRRELSEAEAAGAADFYSTDLAQRVLMTFIAQSSTDNVLKEAAADYADDKEITTSKDALDADKRESAKRMLKALSPRDTADFANALSKAKWFPAFNRIRPQIQALQVKLANRDFTPEHGKAIEEASFAFATAHFEKCEANALKAEAEAEAASAADGD